MQFQIRICIEKVALKKSQFCQEATNVIHFADCKDTVEEKVAVSWKEESKERRHYAAFCISTRFEAYVCESDSPNGEYFHTFPCDYPR